MRMRMIPPLLTLSANIERTVRGRATNPAKLSRTTSVELFSESGRKCRARAALDCAPLVRGEDQCARQCARKYFRSLSACLPIQVAQYEDHLRNLARPRRWFYRRVSWRYLFLSGTIAFSSAPICLYTMPDTPDKYFPWRNSFPRDPTFCESNDNALPSGRCFKQSRLRITKLEPPWIEILLLFLILSLTVMDFKNCRISLIYLGIELLPCIVLQK